MKRKTNAGLIEINSYKTSTDFGFIYEDFKIITLALNDFLVKGTEIAEKTDSDILLKIKNLPKDDNVLLQSEIMSLEYEDMCKNTLSELFTKAALYYVYSKFENSLYIICIRLDFVYNLEESINNFNLKGRDRSALKKYAEFIKKYSTVDFEKLEHWNNVNHVKEIRDLIIHSDGKVLRKYIHFKDLTKEYKNSLSYVSESNYLQITDKFIVNISETLLKFLDNLLTAVWENRTKIN